MAEEAISWLESILPWALAGLALWDSPFSPNSLFRSITITTGVVYLSLYLLASLWQSHVTDIVPEPYLVCLMVCLENKCSYFPG
jgi:hypothetical protein